MSKWNNFNDAEDQMSYEIIPNKTIAKVRLTLKKGNHITDEFTDGYATLSKAGSSIYLACEFVVLSGQYENRKSGAISVFIVIIHQNSLKWVEL